MGGNAYVPWSPVEPARCTSLVEFIIYFTPIETEIYALISCYDVVLDIV